jgi:hypothetical protein
VETKKANLGASIFWLQNWLFGYFFLSEDVEIFGEEEVGTSVCSAALPVKAQADLYFCVFL